jgi:hypothetical protein
MNSIKLFFHKVTHWEYWPFGIVYIPIYFIWLYYSIKARSIFFFNASNPSIKNGGFVNESKKEIYDLIPQKFIPKTLFFRNDARIDDVIKTIQNNGITYPCISKPDIGQKGIAVAIMNSPADVIKYAAKLDMDFLIQELITFQNEVGIFYYRYPTEARGHISGIVYKEFLTVTGDGFTSLLGLIEANPRALLQLPSLQYVYADKLQSIPQKGEQVNLVPIGNHARGTKFIDASNWVTEKLTNVVEGICREVNGFYYGRLDIRYNTFEELEQGLNFSVIEINGAGSEPTHIYDPAHSIFFAWKEIARHYKILLGISMQNHKNGAPYLSLKQGIDMLAENSMLLKKLNQYNISYGTKKKIKMGVNRINTRLANFFAIVHANENVG